MIINGIEIPDAGTTKQYLPDNIGGWMYVVTTDVQVEQVRLDQFKSRIDDMKAHIAQLQAVVDDIAPVVADFEEAIKDIPVHPSAPSENATSTPDHL